MPTSTQTDGWALVLWPYCPIRGGIDAQGFISTSSEQPCWNLLLKCLACLQALAAAAVPYYIIYCYILNYINFPHLGSPPWLPQNEGEGQVGLFKCPFASTESPFRTRSSA